MKNIVLTFLSLIFIACGNDDFSKPSELKNLRVIAITADTPEINGATTVTLTPLISHVNGGGATLNYTWEACPDPGIDFGADMNCDRADASVKQTGSGSFDTSTLSGTYFTGSATGISVSVPASVFLFLGTTTSEIQFNGLDYLVFVTYVDANTSETLKALKRIRLSTKQTSDLNTNPTIGQIQFNSEDLTTFPQGDGKMTLSGLSTGETYQLETNTGIKDFNEEMFVSWHASSGSFLFSRTDIDEANEYEVSGAQGVFVAVYRDGRGGLATVIRSF